MTWGGQNPALLSVCNGEEPSAAPAGQPRALHGMDASLQEPLQTLLENLELSKKGKKVGKKEKENTSLSRLFLLCANQVTTTYTTIPFLLPPISK